MGFGSMGAGFGRPGLGQVLLGGGVRPYLGQVATRTGLMYVKNAPNMYSMSQTWHYARDDIVNPKVLLANWYVVSGSVVEIGPGAPATTTLSILSQGVYTQGLFSGSTTGVIPDGETMGADVPVFIPRGTKFAVLEWRHCTAGILYATDNVQDNVNGDIFRYGPTAAVTDMTMGGTFTSSDTINQRRPIAIVSQTRRPSALLIGDSRMFGVTDTYSDTSGDKGEIARSIGPTLAYTNAGIPGDSATKFSASHTQRVALADYFSHVVLNLGINDMAGGTTDAQLRTLLNTINSYFPTKKVFLATMPPETTSSDSWATTGNQAVIPVFSPLGAGNREAHNDWRRTAPSGFAGTFDIADVTETARNSGLWKSTGAAFGWTPEGVHESNFACTSIRDSGAINVSAFRR